MSRKRPLRPLAVAICIAAIVAVAVPAAAWAATATHYEFTVPTTVTPGVPFNFTVNAVDNTGATDTTYTGPITFSSNDPDAILPAGPQSLTNGTGTFSATLNTPGCRRITATDGTIATSSPPIGVKACDIIDSQTGSLTALDPTQTGVLAYTPPAGQCNTTLTGSLASATGARAYDAYTHVNLANNPICVTVDVTPAAADCDDDAIGNASYLGSFNPANPLANYVSDPGDTSGEIGEVRSESYTVPSGATFVDVVHVMTPGATCSSYIYTLSSDKPFPFSLPTATGAPAVGNVLGFETGTWSDGPIFTFQWRRCDTAGANCGDVPGATSGTYEVTSSDVGSTLRIRVFGSNPLGTSSADSPPTGVVPAPAAAAVTPATTGKRARAIKRCRKKFPKGPKRRKCIKRAKRLPV